MFTCRAMRRKLYEYLDNTLSEEEKLKVKEHLARCAPCQAQCAQIKTVISWSESKKIPVPSEEFWHAFSVELDARLNEKLVPESRLKPFVHWRLTPALVMSVVSVFMLVASASVYFHNKRIFIAGAEEELVNEINILEELSPESNVIPLEEVYNEELN